ncbi:MAG: acyltransferase [Sweet potato little leaf phytoplasma]|nr:acyltransferase [Sweet potato little leaf phytoplasma]
MAHDDEEPSFIPSKWSSVLIHIVNMRRRIQPTLSNHEVGNIYWRSPAYYEASETTTKLADLEIILRQSLSEIDNDFLQKAIGDDGFETLLSSFQELHKLYEKSSDSYLFTSCRNMGFKEVNFGWGKPIWNACGAKTLDSILKNIIILVDTAIGEGIEAWIVLDDETMRLLENDHEFLSFASPNPRIKLA